MKFKPSHAGKWVASKGERVVAEGKTLNGVLKKVENREDSDELRFALIPKGYIAGML